MRVYDDLETMLRRETNSKMPRGAASMIKAQFREKHPSALAFALFKHNTNWAVLPVGPGETYTNTARAAQARHPEHGRAIAYCPRDPVQESKALVRPLQAG